jgi:hypothetical protein
MALTPKQESLWTAELEKMGVSQVRAALDRNEIQSAYVHFSFQWLAGKDREADARKEASTSTQIEIARRASEAAERAATAAEQQAREATRTNMRATIALVIAILSMIVTAIGIGLPLWEAHK